MTSLEDCPFCGIEVRLYENQTEDGRHFWFGKCSCGATISHGLPEEEPDRFDDEPETYTEPELFWVGWQDAPDKAIQTQGPYEGIEGARKAKAAMQSFHEGEHTVHIYNKKWEVVE